jgi:hypothetical protein
MNILDHLRGALRSATVWFNGIAGAAIAAIPILKDEFPAMEQYLSHEVYRLAMGALVAANLLLRVKTNSSLADKGSK